MSKIKTKQIIYLCVFLFSAKSFSQNLLINGDFESGGSGTGFTVPNYNLHNPASGGITPGNYAISNNPTPLNTFFIPNIMDHTVGAGNNMMVVDGSTSGSASFWGAGNDASGLCGLTAGSTYTFSYWIRTISSTTVDNTTQPNISANFTNASGVVRIFGSPTVALPTVGWQQVAYSFTANAACVNINLVNINLSPAGNDFALDDLSVTLQLCPPVVLSINNPDPVCFPNTVNITDAAVTLGSIGGGILSYWTDAAGTIPLVSPPPSAINVTGTYYIKSTSGPTCSDIKAVTIVVKPVTLPLFAQVPDICSGDVLTPLPTVSNNGIVGVWSPAINNTQTTQYVFTPSTAVIPNLITNGDFSMGNTGFTTDYNFLPTSNGTSQGVYGITTNANTWANFAATCTDHTGGGNFLVADTNITLGGNARVWCQSVPVNAGENYIFGYFANSIVSNDPARLQVTINGVVIGTTNLSSTTCAWNQSAFSWNAGTSTTAEICVFSRNAIPNGNDFGIDEISFRSTGIQCAIPTTMTITVNPRITPTFATVAPICVGDILAPLPTTSIEGVSGTWSPALNNTASATYTFTPNPRPIPTQVINGDFSQGNTGFTSDYSYTPGSNSTAGQYTVATNPSSWNAGFPSACQGNGGLNSYLVVNGSTNASNRVWCQTINVRSGEMYQLKYFSQTLVSAGPARLEVLINGVLIGGNTLPSTICNWVQSSFNWNSGTSTTATICIFNRNTDFFGNDFGIDDISFKSAAEQCAVATTIGITVNPLPVLTSLTATNATICNNDTARFTLVGTANATVTYTLNGGISQTVVLNAAGTASVTVPMATANQVITLSTIALGSCSQAITNTATVTVSPLPVLTSLTATNATICNNETAQFTLVGTPNATVTYTLNAGISQTVVLSASGTASVNVPMATTNQVITLSTIALGTCSQAITNTATVTVSPLPTLTSITATNATICNNDTAQFTLVGTANATVTYTLNAAASQTVVLNPAGTASVNVPTATANQVITLSSIALGTCSQAITNTATVTVSPLPTLTSITATNATICNNDTAQFTLVGTANATVTYTLNAGISQTVVLNPAGTASVNVPTATANQVITLSSITLGTCSQAITNTATVTVSPLPTLTSITATNATICNNDTAQFTLVGTANATVTYTLNAGISQTVVLNAAGTASVAVPMATTNQVITLSTIALGTCSQAITNTATITVNPLTVLTSLTPTSVGICANETAEFILVGTPNATVSYTINGGSAETAVLNTTGNGVVTVPTATTNQVITLSAITLGTCSQTIANTATVTVNPLPVLTSLTPTSVGICENDTAEFTLVGTANATVSYTINGGASQTVVLNATGTASVTVPMATTNQVITLSTIALGTCSQAITNTATVTVNPIVTPTFDPVGPICFGDFLAPLPTTSLNGITGNWTPSLNNTETTTYTFIPNAVRQCTPTTYTTLTIVVNTPATPDFSDLVPICAGSVVPILETTSPNGITGTWSPQIINNTISGDYTFTPNLGQCAVSQTLSVTVNQVTLTDVVLLAGEDFSGDGTITVNAISTGNYEYQLDDGNTQSENIFENVSPGIHTVTVYDLNGCSNSITKEILILDYPKFFTPNGDGFNETWNIKGLEGQPNAKIYIFDRFGKLLKQIVPSNEGWNGKFNGEELPSTDYWFTVDYLSQASPKQFKAHFSLKR